MELKVTKPTTREEWLQRFVELSRKHFKAAGHPLPKRVRVSVGFPSKGIRSSTIGECWASSETKDNVCEIFIRPSLQDDASRIADVLTHELCHAVLGHEAGHGKSFKLLATSLGLTGKMTATTAGEAWHAWADPILKALGRFPATALAGHLAGGKKKQTTRMIKLTCDGCGWACRTTRSHIDGHGLLNCPIEGCDGFIEEER